MKQHIQTPHETVLRMQNAILKIVEVESSNLERVVITMTAGCVDVAVAYPTDDVEPEISDAFLEFCHTGKYPVKPVYRDRLTDILAQIGAI